MNMLEVVVGRMMVPKVVYTLISRSCQYVMVHGKKDFANVINGMNLDRGRLYWVILVDSI